MAISYQHFELTSYPKAQKGLNVHEYFYTLSFAFILIISNLPVIPTSYIRHHTSEFPYSPPQNRHSPLFSCQAKGLFRILQNKKGVETLIDVKTKETFLIHFVSSVFNYCTFAALN